MMQKENKFHKTFRKSIYESRKILLANLQKGTLITQQIGNNLGIISKIAENHFLRKAHSPKIP